MMRHIENPDIEQFIQAFSVMVKHAEGHLGIFRHIQPLLRHNEPYSKILVESGGPPLPFLEN